MIRYSMGFVVSEDGASVLLLCKSRPAFLVGKWTGIGGHIEPGETPLAAMVRECEEECGLQLPADRWQQLPTIFRPNAEINMYCAKADIHLATAVTDEEISPFTWAEARQQSLSDSAEEMLPIIESMFARRLSPSTM
jgi:8-oxo-dGTP pyrophosphatase MutT (NUDIX family)